MTYLLLTHGAGGNRNAPLLVAIASAFSEHQVEVVRYDLAFRQARPHGPPRPGDAARDREGLHAEILKLRSKHADKMTDADKIWLGGASYGGRQASMLAAENPGLADRLLLLSYPLHAPGKPGQLRTAHFPNLQTPTLFVHGTRDPFGTTEEFQDAVKLIPAPVQLLEIEGVGHDLGRSHAQVAAKIVSAFLALSA
jgi:predicted alpha/beta-hydrolase family hydrolase